MKTTAESAQEYFDEIPAERRFTLETVRRIVLDTWPKIVEDMHFGMPTYHLNGHPFCAMANQKHFMAIYIMPYDLLNAFVNDLRIHDTGRSCIRFKRLDPTMVELFERIVKYTGSQHSTSKYYGKPIVFRVNSRVK